MKITISPTRQVDLSLGLRNALTKKVWKTRRTGTGQRGRHKKGEEEEGKQEREGRDRRLRGRGRGRIEPKVPFSPTLFMDASKAYMRVAYERNSS